MHRLADPQPVAASLRKEISARTERRRAIWILALAIASFAALALPCLLGQIYVADDLGAFHLPLRAFYTEQLAAGGPFDWMPNLFGGFYVTGEGQLGAYHPLHRALYQWLPLPVAFDLELLLSYPFMFAGMYLWLRQRIGRRDAAMFGALAFTFGGFNLLHFVHPNAVAIVAHIPWLLWACDAVLTLPPGTRRATYELAVGLLIASQLLLGYPQYVWLSLLTLAAYVVWRAVVVGVPWPRLTIVGLVVVLGILTAAVQWVPTLDALSNSTRETADAEFVNSGALHPLNLVQLVGPYLFSTRVVGQNTHELGLYAGAVPLVLCVWLFSQRGRLGQFRQIARAATALGGVSLLLAFGNTGGLYRLQQLVPFANHFRFPCRAIVLVQLSIAVVAAIAVALLTSGGEQNEAAQRRARRTLGSVFALSVFLAISAPLLWPEFVASSILVWCGPLLVGAAALLVWLAQQRVVGAVALLAVLTAVDLSCYGLSYSVWPHTTELDPFIATVPQPPTGPGTRIAVDESDQLRTGNAMLLAGAVRIDGYAGLEPRKQLDPTSKAARQRAGAQFVLLPSSAGKSATPRWQPVAPTAPRVRLAARTVSIDATSDLSDLGLDTVALDKRVELSDKPAGLARVIRDAPGYLEVAYHAPARQILATTESHHSGWTTTLDGQRRPTIAVDGDFVGCIVEPGAHRVVFRFAPRSLRLGKWLSFCGLGLLLFTFALETRRRTVASP